MKLCLAYNSFAFIQTHVKANDVALTLSVSPLDILLSASAEMVSLEMETTCKGDADVSIIPIDNVYKFKMNVFNSLTFFQ